MIPMKATKALTYNTRRLLPGDTFEAVSSRDARVLKAIRKAEQVRPQADVPPPSPAVAARIAAAVAPGQSTAPAVDDDLVKARTEYRDALGRPPFHGWDAATLREKIAAAKTE